MLSILTFSPLNRPADASIKYKYIYTGIKYNNVYLIVLVWELTIGKDRPLENTP